MPVHEALKMCGECPFRKDSPRGWLGGWDVKEIDRIARSDEGFICHESVDELTQSEDDFEELKERGKEPSEDIKEHGQQCVGMLRYRNSIHKLNRDPLIAKYQKDLRFVKDDELIEPGKFIEHHGKG